MKNSFNVKFALVAIVVALVLTGLAFTEIIQSNARQENLRKAEIRKKLDDNAPALVQSGVDKILAAQELSFTDAETFNAFGCTYTKTYDGRFKGQEEYAKNNIKYDNHALIKDICPTQYNEVMSFLSGEHYWDPSGNSSDYSPIDKPSEYIRQFLRENAIGASIREINQNEDNFLLRTRAIKDKTMTDYDLVIDKKNEQITHITYSKSGDSSFTSDTGEFSLKYSVNIVSPTFNEQQ